ncbi:cytochrome P450 [Legionella bononiensis]|uniref:Cytochrome P450 n=1 Tax=Legionella bononiensis TaxID=2793102 RepID=A0ABS1W8H1_9GAMM|nr:cytochrome P450 [Legionella bononiensis]MBL7525651.1 cytochrome P450 [Legionella bononiensis]MBL7561834.1 cytochrome P450 [Legionella bononiensis]
MLTFYEELTHSDVSINWTDWKDYIPFYDAFALWQNGSDYILSEGYQRSKNTGVGVIDPLPYGGVLRQLPIVSRVASLIPSIYVFSGTKSNLEAIAEYGEHVNDTEAREPHERVKQATDATTIVNLLGADAKAEKQKIRNNLSSDNAFQCAKEFGANVSAIWDNQLSLQDNITYMGATIIGRCFLGIQEFPRQYVPLIRQANDLIVDGNAKSEEFAKMKAQMVAMSDAVLGANAQQIIESNGYVCSQFQLDGTETQKGITEKLISSHGGAGFIVESNLSFLIMVALAHISTSPLILEQLREEILSHGEITENSFNELVYLDCIYRETLRFASPTAVVPRKASISSTMDIEDNNKEKTSCTIYPNSFLFFAIRSTHHDPELWHDPQVFDPLRFMSAAKERKMHFIGDHYFPFSGGKRGCPAGTTFVEKAFKGFVFEFFKNHSLVLDKPLEDIPAFAVHPRWKQEYFAQLTPYSEPVQNNEVVYCNNMSC